MCGTTTTDSTDLTVVENTSACSCCATDAPSEQASTEIAQEANVNVSSYSVTGMTCGHCASAVTSKLQSQPGVNDVQVELVAGGTSTIKITSGTPLTQAQVSAALDEAGDYQLVSS